MTLSATNLGIEGLHDVEQIGSGGSSRVYRARQVDLDRAVAVKVLNPGGDQGVAKRFDRERKAMGRLSLHEGIVPIYSSGITTHGEPFLVMPYYPNGSLQDQIDAGPMEWQTAVSYVDVAADTIATAHDEGVVHLDLKPANILLTNTGAPRIADFGIARLLTGAATAGTTGGGTAFTPAYSAPETFLDDKTGPPADVYGLGATLWALLAGHPPFLTPGDDTNLMAVIGRVVNNPVGDLRAVAPGDICDVVERAMAKKPEDRYQTAREFSRALKHAAALVSPDFAAPVNNSGPARTTTLFASPVTTQTPAGGATPEPPRAAPATELAPATAQVPVASPTPPQKRPLLHNDVQPLPKPVNVAPPESPIPFIDLDRFRIGPIVFAVLAFVLLVAAAVWVFNRESARTADTSGEPATSEEAPAGPQSQSSTDSSAPTVSSTVAGSASTTSTPADDVTTSSSSQTSTSATTASTTSTSTATSTSTSTSTSSTSSSSSSTTTTSTTSTTLVPTPPGPPTGLVAPVTGSSVNLSWQAPATGPTPVGYRVFRNGTVVYDNVTGTTKTDPDLAPGTYLYTVRSIGEDGAVSAPGAPKTATIAPAPLAITEAGFTLSATRVRATVSFTTNGCDTYRVRALAVPGGTGPAALTGPCADGQNTVVVIGLDPALDYQINIVVRRAPDEEVSLFLPPGDEVRPPAPVLP